MDISDFVNGPVLTASGYCLNQLTLTYHYLSPVILSWGQFFKRYHNHHLLKWAWGLLVWNLILSHTEHLVNYCHTGLNLGNLKRRVHFLSPFDTGIAQVNELATSYIAYSALWLLTSWRLQRPDNEYPHYWPTYHRILPFRHTKGYDTYLAWLNWCMKMRQLLDLGALNVIEQCLIFILEISY